MPSDLDALIASIELTRRERKYGKMRDYARKALRQLDGSRLSLRLASRVNYELHMAEFQQYEACKRGAGLHLRKSLELAQQSVKQAYGGNDEVGALFALANISGLIMPAGGGLIEGLLVSGAVCSKAEEVARNPTTGIADRRRAQRVAMNTYFHRIRVVMTLVPDKAMCFCVREWLRCVKRNPLYLSIQDELCTEVEAAGRFVTGAIKR